MRVVLEIASGPRKGGKTVLGELQTRSVGRSEWADFPCDYDQKMSRVHFTVRTDAVGCYLSDHTSRNGTFVNGMRVTDCRLRDGDRIEAGSSAFAVRIEGDQVDNAPAAGGPSFVPVDLDSGIIKASKGTLNVRYTSEVCESGLTLYRGNVEKLAPPSFADILSSVYPLHLIVHTTKFELPLPEDLGAPQYLFDWLEPAAQQAASPVLLSPGATTKSWKPFVEEGWGQDSVICLFSSKKPDELLAQLRALCRAKTHAADDSQGVFGYCWPGVLAPLLTHYSKDLVARLMNGIEAVLVEFPDLPETWQLFGAEKLKDVLKKFGIKPDKSEPETASLQPVVVAPRQQPPPASDDTIMPH